MTKLTPFTLRIFVADGNPDGLRIVERSNWIGKAIVFPRALYPQVRQREEFQQTGVYLLLGAQDGEAEGDRLYIGEGDPVKPRLEQHYAKKDFWTKAVFFIAGSGQLNKAHVQYLESKLIKLAVQAKRINLDNGNSPAEPSLSEPDVADMEVFLSNILTMLPVLGVHAFEQPEIAANPNRHVLVCQGKGVSAKGYDTASGFVVLSGSFACTSTTPSLAQKSPATCELRAQLLNNGVLAKEDERSRFTQDYTFSSPSLAASIVLGRAANGRTSWKDAQGKTLKELQEAQVGK